MDCRHERKVVFFRSIFHLSQVKLNLVYSSFPIYRLFLALCAYHHVHIHYPDTNLQSDLALPSSISHTHSTPLTRCPPLSPPNFLYLLKPSSRLCCTFYFSLRPMHQGRAATISRSGVTVLFLCCYQSPCQKLLPFHRLSASAFVLSNT